MSKYILYGAGEYGIKALKYFGFERVECFVDKTVCGFVEGVKVISPSELVDYVKVYGGDVVITPQNLSIIVDIAIFLKKIDVRYRLLTDAMCDLIEEEAEKYNKINHRSSFGINKLEMHYCPLDRISPAGQLSPYMWQDLWAAKHIYARKPEIHYDIGSRIDGFITHLMCYGQNVKLIDIRPLNNLDGVDFIQSDATNLIGIDDNSIDSLSALCSLEHFGLGRYGDSIDPEGCFKAFNSIERKMRPGGEILIAVPVGREHVEFNAHRVFNAQTVIEAFGNCELLEYSAALHDRIEYDINIHKYDDIPKHGGGVFGLFRMRKR